MNRFGSLPRLRKTNLDYIPIVFDNFKPDTGVKLRRFKDYYVFEFLNLEKRFDSNHIEWNFPNYGKLWTYNLNYFEYLNCDELSVDEKLVLIHNYCDAWETLKDGLDPYPISLRTINWIKFLSINRISDSTIDQRLFHQICILEKRLEFHIRANHLLENAFALLFGAYYFQDENLYNKSKDLLIDQLEEQVLEDGAHYERSPMYHQIILYRLLDTINLVKNNSWQSQDLILRLTTTAASMLSWLSNISTIKGDIPFVKDSAPRIAPNTEKLFDYASELGIEIAPTSLGASNYRWLEKDSLEMLIDIGMVEPSFQPGHAHADELNFLVYWKGDPIIVDQGISTYEKNERRQFERSTQSHNCIVIDEQNSSKVWGGFRVAQRARVNILKDSNEEISADHDGFQNLGVLVTRQFRKTSSGFAITTLCKESVPRSKKSYVHFHPDITLERVSEYTFKVDPIWITFSQFENIEIEEYKYARGYNDLVSAERLVLANSEKSTINIYFEPI